MKKIIIDTDIGDDIDDALALSLAVQMNAELIGITTVFKNTQQRAAQAKKLLSILGKSDLPVYAGYGNSLAIQNNTEETICQYTDDLEDECYRSENYSEGAFGQAAVDYLINMANKYGDELIILCIGPLTNMARAIKQNESAISKIHRIVLMGGFFYEPIPEWNMLCDPEAAAVVMSANVPKYCVGCDVTQHCIMDSQQTKRMLNCESKLGKYLGIILSKWIEKEKRLPILHDPLAVWTVLRDDIVSFEKISVAVELKEKDKRGLTYNLGISADENFADYIYAAKTVEADAFKNKFLELVF